MKNSTAGTAATEAAATETAATEAAATETAATESATIGTATSETPLNVTVVIGSNRHGRFGPVVADWLLERVRERDELVVDVVDVADVTLPTTMEPAPHASDPVSVKLAAADAFVVLTPEYNHSFPAALKNLIDWHFTEWQAKPVALVSYGGISGGLRATEHLRQVFAELHAVTVRDTVSFHNAAASFTPEGRLKDPSGPDAAAKKMLDQLTWWARALHEAKQRRPYGG